MKKEKLPPMSHSNKLETFAISKDFECLKLTDLEQCIIARSLLFMKIHKLPKSRMGAVKDKIVNVPISEEDVRNTLDVLMRTPNQAGIVAVKIKRRQQYKSAHKEEYVSVEKVKKALLILKELGHKYYQFNEDLNHAASGFESLEEPENKYLFKDVTDEINNNSLQPENIDPVPDKVPDPEDEVENHEREMEEYLSRDPVAKFQFDYNRNTCFVNEYPEHDPNVSVSIAPGEGKTPKSILMDTDWDMKAFPVLDPTGENSLNAKRERKLSYQQFFMQRLLNINRRFAESPSFMFAAVQYVEAKQLQSNLNIAFQRGRPTKSGNGVSRYTLDDPYSVMDNVKGTPKYTKKKKNEFIGKLENLGCFTFFFTLSCADMRWSENFTSLLHLEGYKINYSTEFDEVLIEDPNDPDQMLSIAEFLDLNEGKHEFIRKNILNSTRNFDQRVKLFIKNIIMSKYNEMHASFYNYRVEFQLRGAGHIHGCIWINFKDFMKDERNAGFQGIDAVFEKITNEQKLTSKEKALVAAFADKFITVSIKDPSTKDIVSQVNVHHHTRACRKYGTKCRFFYPKFPIDKTLVAEPAKVLYEDEKDRAQMKSYADLILTKVRDVLEDEEKMEEILEDTKDRSPRERIVAVLVASKFGDFFNVTDHGKLYNAYKRALQISGMCVKYGILLE